MISPNELDQIEDQAPEMEPFWLRAAVVRLVAELRQMRAVAELADQINARKSQKDFVRDWPEQIRQEWAEIRAGLAAQEKQ